MGYRFESCLFRHLGFTSDHSLVDSLESAGAACRWLRRVISLSGRAVEVSPVRVPGVRLYHDGLLRLACFAIAGLLCVAWLAKRRLCSSPPGSVLCMPRHSINQHAVRAD